MTSRPRPNGVFIVKIQAALSPPNADWLIYNQNRSLMRQASPLSFPAWTRKVMSKTPKAYFRAKMGSGDDLLMIQRTADQPW